MPIIRQIPAESFHETPAQSIEVRGTKAAGQTARWGLGGEYDGLTLPDLFESGLSQSADRPCLGHREVVSVEPLKYADEYSWQTYTEVDVRRKAVGSGIHNLFQSGRLPPGQDFQGVGIWAVNRPGRQTAAPLGIELLIFFAHRFTVALYDTLGPNSVEYVINHSELSLIFCTENHLPTLIKLSENCPSLRMIVSFDPLDPSTKASLIETASQRGIEILEMKQLEAGGIKNPVQPIKATLDQLAAVSYTSGTTANPKGYFTGSPANLLADMQVLKPHFFPSVPRVLNKIYASLMAATQAPGLKGMINIRILFRQAVATKEANFQVSGGFTHILWDALVFRKAQAVLGGQVNFITSASAPISRSVVDFLKIAFACEVMEGYGLTETCASGSRTLADDPLAASTIGGATPGNELKLVDVPELEYRSSDTPNPRGELCVRGANVFTRYYKDEKKTREAIDEEGWFHTGDVAELDAAGRFKIIDRVKNIMKLSQGEYVALEKIENVYSTCPVVAQIFIYGDSLKDFIVAVVVPEIAALSGIAAKAGCTFDSNDTTGIATAVRDPNVNKAVLEAMTAHAKKSGLKGFETVRGVHLSLEPFSTENNTLTPTFKIRRKDAYDLYRGAIDGLYA
ncbi:hypothetical protein FRB97_006723 [Tulasnella sp. 331]|nr:hypothetical protein FRB97_006723 [Tulasnella sp. 331]